MLLIGTSYINETARGGTGRDRMARIRLELAIVDSSRYKVPNLRGHAVFKCKNKKLRISQLLHLKRRWVRTLYIQEGRRCLQMLELKDTPQVLQAIVPVRRHCKEMKDKIPQRENVKYLTLLVVSDKA